MIRFSCPIIRDFDGFSKVFVENKMLREEFSNGNAITVSEVPVEPLVFEWTPPPSRPKCHHMHENH